VQQRSLLEPNAAKVLGVLSWNPDTISFTALTLLAAVWGVVHLALSVRAAREQRLPMWLRALGWLPPLTPAAGFLCGARVRAVVWCVVAVTYLVIRTRV
jgi:hypothetical protein